MPTNDSCHERAHHERAQNPATAAETSVRRAKLFAVGGLVGALAASSCCILPLVFFSLGVSGAWIGNFTRLAPYQPYFLAVTAACLGYGYWLVRRSRQGPCADGAACARPLPNRILITGFVLATILAGAALAFDFVGPLIFTS